MTEQAEILLRKYWGHRTFRPPQEAIIQAVISNRDVLALLPTGGGKSICFQLPALLKPGLCIVISPLVALMHDQVKQLKNKGIKAIALSGGMRFDDIDAALDNCIYGDYKFLYLSPERLKQELVIRRIQQMPVNLIAIDEAHCISQWGHDFRPAYLECNILREYFPEVPIIALTASATRKVLKDIATLLEMPSPSIFKKTLSRPNIYFDVSYESDKRYALEKILNNFPGASIVYVRSRKATVEISSFLSQKGYPSSVYHGGLSAEEKKVRFDDWINNRKPIMVATNAFGMGIDKADVRNVIHLQLPDSLESYYQEAGRAGRDGLPSRAVILTNEADIQKVKDQFLSILPDKAFIRLLYRKLNNYLQIAYGEGHEEVYQFNFNRFCSEYSLNTTRVYNGLKLLDRHSIIYLSENFNRQTRIQFTVENQQLFSYMRKRPELMPVTQTLLRTYGGLFDLETKISTALVSTKCGVTESSVITVLKQLEKDEIISYIASHTDMEISFQVPREDDHTINKIAPYIKEYNLGKKKQIARVIRYVEQNNSCKVVQLLQYFGEDNIIPCGNCVVCNADKKDVKEPSFKEIEDVIQGVLKKKSYSSRVLSEKLIYKESTILEVLRSLMNKGVITVNSKNEYELKQ